MNDMGQLMGEKPTPATCSRPVLSMRKHNFPADRIGQRVHCPGRFGGLVTGVYPHVTEVMSEARLEKRARGRIERLPGTEVSNEIVTNGAHAIGGFGLAL